MACLQRGGIPLDDDGPYCIDDNKLELNTTDVEDDHMYFPYPEPGNWYLTLQAYCYNDTKYVWRIRVLMYFYRGKIMFANAFVCSWGTDPPPPRQTLGRPPPPDADPLPRCWSSDLWCMLGSQHSPPLPPVNSMTDAIKTINLPQTSFVDGNNWSEKRKALSSGNVTCAALGQ